MPKFQEEDWFFSPELVSQIVDFTKSYLVTHQVKAVPSKKIVETFGNYVLLKPYQFNLVLSKMIHSNKIPELAIKNGRGGGVCLQAVSQTQISLNGLFHLVPMKETELQTILVPLLKLQEQETGNLLIGEKRYNIPVEQEGNIVAYLRSLK